METRNCTHFVDHCIFLGFEKSRHWYCPHCGSIYFVCEKKHARRLADLEENSYLVHYCTCSKCKNKFLLAPPIVWPDANYSSATIIQVLMVPSDVPDHIVAHDNYLDTRTVAKWSLWFKEAGIVLKLFYEFTRCSSHSELVRNLLNDEERRRFESFYPGMKLPLL